MWVRGSVQCGKCIILAFRKLKSLQAAAGFLNFPQRVHLKLKWDFYLIIFNLFEIHPLISELFELNKTFIYSYEQTERPDFELKPSET